MHHYPAQIFMRWLLVRSPTDTKVEALQALYQMPQDKLAGVVPDIMHFLETTPLHVSGSEDATVHKISLLWATKVLNKAVIIDATGEINSSSVEVEPSLRVQLSTLDEAIKESLKKGRRHLDGNKEAP